MLDDKFDTTQQQVLSAVQNKAFEPVTPPLLRMTPPTTPYIPLSPDADLPLLSDPASLISEDARKAEKAIFEDDTLAPPSGYNSPMTDSSATLASYTHVRLSDVYSTTTSHEILEQNIPSAPPKIADLKVEVPLTPQIQASTHPKTVTFSDAIEEMLLDPASKDHEGKSPMMGSDEFMDKFFQDAFGEAASQVNRAIEQEQLQEADAKARVEVPIMDFSLPDPPWKQLQEMSNSTTRRKVQKAMVMEILQGESEHFRVWPGASKNAQNLNWIVFPSELTKGVLHESFGDDSVLQQFINPSQDEAVTNSSGVTWKPPGLRILKDDETDDEEEIELGSFQEEQPKDVVSLVKKRKLQYAEEDPSLVRPVGVSMVKTSAGDMTRDPAVPRQEADEETQRKQNQRRSAMLPAFGDFVPASKKLEADRTKEISLILGGPFSASDSLDNFLEIRASKRQKPVDSAYFAVRSPAKRATAAALDNMLENPPIVEQHRPARRPLPVPLIQPRSTPSYYIISSGILRHRLFVRTLGALLPAAIQIERDFTAHNTTAWLPGSVTRSPIASSLDSEADIIVSPSTGIIITTLQKIKQKPLPGQKSKGAFKERLEKVSLRYGRLVVLVSEGCADESTNGLVEFDSLAIAEVTGFCGTLGTNIIVQFVAGGQETLAKWLGASMIQFGVYEEATTPLLQDETLWELFLRRAGMNAFAAQAVIAQLKAPEGVDADSPTKAGMFGITAFVEMGPEERMRRFGGLLGGSGVLHRVGRVLDASWS
jgi:hypothetical protein